ncbi:MAG: tetratricopeptide repeat protein, partial [Pyrinomonadaceae bacterium]|nr:tetratricopeptide repeat protein [Pyrinomonadaceae bacterium]
RNAIDEAVTEKSEAVTAPADPNNQPAGSDNVPTLEQVQEKIDRAKANPKDADAQIQAAHLYVEIERFDDALELYQKAAELEPENFEANANIGKIFLTKRDYEKAGEYYEKALSVNDKNAGIRSDLGLTYYLRTPRNTERAVKEYRAALELDPEHESTLQNLSVALKDLGQEAERTKILDRLKKVNPDNIVFKEPS